MGISRLKNRIWFWKPQWYWFGWKTLVPLYYGHDEFARRTFMFGWTITGRVIIAVWNCGDPLCIKEMGDPDDSIT